ncbi:kinesin protein KIN-5B [Trifolium repens]|nr:kinesin protein KIN-5B [Trifolium repens]
MIKMNFRSPLETGHHIANSAFSSWTLQCHWRVQAQEKAPTYLACGPAVEGVLTLACFMDLAVKVDKFYELYLTEQEPKLNLEKELEDCKGEKEKKTKQRLALPSRELQASCFKVGEALHHFEDTEIRAEVGSEKESYNNVIIAREIYVGNGDKAVIDVMVSTLCVSFSHIIEMNITITTKLWIMPIT